MCVVLAGEACCGCCAPAAAETQDLTRLCLTQTQSMQRCMGCSAASPAEPGHYQPTISSPCNYLLFWHRVSPSLLCCKHIYSCMRGSHADSHSIPTLELVCRPTQPKLPAVNICCMHPPFGPMEVRVIWDRALQASMFFITASSTPLKCLCPSLSMACRPYGSDVIFLVCCAVLRRQLLFCVLGAGTVKTGGACTCKGKDSKAVGVVVVSVPCTCNNKQQLGSWLTTHVHRTSTTRDRYTLSHSHCKRLCYNRDVEQCIQPAGRQPI